MAIYTYKNLLDRVSKFLGTYGDSGPSGEDLTEAQEVVKSGYLRFLNAYHWTFLRKFTTLSTVEGQYIYTLPSDFVRMIVPFKPYGSVSLIVPEEISEEILMQKRGLDDSGGEPQYFALRSGVYDPQLGQRKEVLFWQTPTTEYTYYFGYQFMPPMMTLDSDTPIGGHEHAETILQMCLSAAETLQDEAAGVQSEMAMAMLDKSIRLDMTREPRSVSDPDNYYRWYRPPYRTVDITGFSESYS